ncbi:MAG: hypothetical protein ACQERZ_09895 [Fusobacteriota bacterium]
MRNQKKIILLLVLICLMISITACTFGNKTERIRKKIKSYLYEKYGEEFVVDRIGMRTSRGDEFYQAKIYPKSIIGTSKENDDYYYASATVEKLYFGRLGGVGDSYSYIKMNLGAEKHLMPKAKEIFGKKILLKVDSRIEIWGREEIIAKEYSNNEGTDAFIGYKESDFKEARQRVIEDPKRNKLFLELYVYVFDRLEDKEEKEKRRKDIFQFVQYLKEEGLFQYLEMGVIFIDERVLADSYDKYERKVYYSDKVKKVVEGERVKLPPLKLRKEMSKELKQEVNEMSEEKLLANMKKIKKENLDYKGIRKENSSYNCWIYSKKLLKEKYPTSYKNKPELRKEYDKVEDIILGKNLEYIYVN